MPYRPLTDLPMSFTTSLGTPLANGVLRAFEAGTSTPTAMYADNAGTSAGTSITLDSRGEPTTIKQVWVDTAVDYKFTLEDAAGTVVWTVDDILGSGTIADVDFSTGLVTATGTTDARTLANRFADVVNVLDFADQVTDTDDGTAAITAALALNRDVYIPDNVDWRIGDVTVTGVRVYGGGTLRKKSTAAYALALAGDGAIIEGLRFRPQSASGQPNTDIKFLDGCTNPTVKGCVFYGGTYSAVTACNDTTDAEFPYTDNVINATITGNTFIGYTRPVFLLCLNSFTITNNYFTQSDFDAIRIREVIGEGVITNNRFRDVGDPTWPDAQTRDAIDTAFSGSKLIISNNIALNCAFSGFDIKGIDRIGDGYSSRSIIVANNYIEGCRYSGISIAEADTSKPDFIWGFTVTGNHVVRCNLQNESGAGSVGDAAINVTTLVRYVNVSDNICVANYARGINIARTTAETSNVHSLICKGNICVNNLENGFNFQDVYHAVISGNISGNDTSSYTVSPASGFIMPQTTGQTHGFGFAFTNTLSKRSVIFTENVAFANSSRPVSFAGSNALSDAFSKYANNHYTGTDSDFAATNRARWAQAGKRTFWGNGTAPTASEGTFLTGDVIWNVAPLAGGPSGVRCIAGGNPGTWENFAYGAMNASATYNPASLADGDRDTTTVTVTGASLGDFVNVSFAVDLQGINMFGYVSAADTVTVVFENRTGGTIDLVNSTIRVRVRRRH